MIQELTGRELYFIEPVTEYDTIYLGYPNYWGTMPMHIAIPDLFDCIKCGKCEHICPQHLIIRDLLVDVAEEFETRR